MENKGLVKQNPAEATTGHIKKSYSTFDKSLSYRNLYTAKFGYYYPTFDFESVPTDVISVNSIDHIDSMSLKAPFKDAIRKEKRSFMVPMMALLPFNWDQIYALPASGDDIPNDANTVIENFQLDITTYLRSALGVAYANIPSSFSSSAATALSSDTAAWYTAILRVLILWEYIYSAGSLINMLGANFSQRCRIGSYYQPGQTAASSVARSISFDTAFDDVITALFGSISSIRVSVPDGSTPRQFTFAGPSNQGSFGIYDGAPFRGLLDLFRENPSAEITGLYNNNDVRSIADLAALASAVMVNTFGNSSALSNIVITYPASSYESSPSVSDDPTSLDQANFNFAWLAAYQMICHHYYTNSLFDFVYSADLYRQYFRSIYFNLFSSSGGNIEANGASLPTFSWNGIHKPYDFLSGYCIKRCLYFNSNTQAVSGITYSDLTSPGVFTLRASAWSMLFGFRRSLRYGDYFTGARPTPLASGGSYDVAVSQNSSVSVIDITRGIQMQRLGNAVMRWRNKIEEYVDGMFGRRPAPDYHNPFALAAESELIFGEDVQNTADAQQTDPNSRTANFVKSGGRFTYTFRNEDNHPCIYMQIIGFDLRRAYTSATRRHFFQANRFDMFNPAFQYIGDQPVYLAELGYNISWNNASGAFGYKTRDAEYKESYDIASGGFVENLPGWAFTDANQAAFSIGSNTLATINDDFIRSWPCELDQFYLSLTGYSLGSCFHFVMITENLVSAKRPMAVDPQILA